LTQEDKNRWQCRDLCYVRTRRDFNYHTRLHLSKSVSVISGLQSNTITFVFPFDKQMLWKLCCNFYHKFQCDYVAKQFKQHKTK